MSRVTRRRLLGPAPAILLAFLGVSYGAHAAAKHAELLITHGTIYDGRGGEPYEGAVAISAGRVLAIGKLEGYTADRTVDARGLAVAPGFINMLSWAGDTLIQD